MNLTKKVEPNFKIVMFTNKVESVAYYYSDDPLNKIDKYKKVRDYSHLN